MVFCTQSSLNCKLFTILGSIPALNTFFLLLNLFDALSDFFIFMLTVKVFQHWLASVFICHVCQDYVSA